MIKDAVSPLEPRYEDLAGDGLGRKARRHFLATRPKFLTASVLPVLVGTAWGATVAGRLELGVALLAVLATALVHCASNVINDVGDDITGTDRDNVEYIHPYTGGSRFITNGIMSVQEMHRWGWILIGMASVLGLALALLKGPIVIALGLAGIAIAVAVFRAAVQLSGKGVGEFFSDDRVRRVAGLRRGVAAERRVRPGQPAARDPVGIWVMLILRINECRIARPTARTASARWWSASARPLAPLVPAAARRRVRLDRDAGQRRGVCPGGLRSAPAALAGGFKAAAGIGEEFDAPVLTKSIEMTIGLQAVGSALLDRRLVVRGVSRSTSPGRSYRAENTTSWPNDTECGAWCVRRLWTSRRRSSRHRRRPGRAFAAAPDRRLLASPEMPVRHTRSMQGAPGRLTPLAPRRGLK